MTDQEIDDLIEMYLTERDGLVVIYRRQLRLTGCRSYAFFVAVCLKDSERIRRFMPIYWQVESPISNQGIFHIIEHLIDTEDTHA